MNSFINCDIHIYIYEDVGWLGGKKEAAHVVLRERTSWRVGPSPGGRVLKERPAGCAALGRSVTALPARRALVVLCVAARSALLLFRHLLCLSTSLELLV